MADCRQSRRWKYWWIALSFLLMLCLADQASSQIRYSVPEEVKEGYPVGNISKDLGLDVTTLVNRGFRVVSRSNDALFLVNQRDGVLYVDKKIDREQICDGVSSCVIDLKIVVENPLEIHYVAVDITDVNDHAPIFPEKRQTVEIAETALSSARFQLRSARDPDLGANSVRFYKLTQNEQFDLEIRDRGEEKVPFLVLQRALDREHKAEHELVMTAIDGGNPPRSGTLNIIVTVLDINDNRPVFSQEVYTTQLHENVPIGAVVIKVNATDLDEGLNGEVIYSLGRNYSEFSLDHISGEIRVKDKIDFENTDIYRLDVLASDKGSPSMTVDCLVIVKILDINDNTPEIEITSLSNLVPEDSKPGSVISLISVLDKDSGVNGKILCTLSPLIPFELKPSIKDNMYSLVTKMHLDREETSRYEITVTATDLGQPPMSAVKILSVQVSDVNDNSPQFPKNPLEVHLFENNIPGASLFSITATDKDIDENAAVLYSILRGGSAHDDMVSFLNVNSETGVIYALKRFDFEVIKSFQFHVLAKDRGTPPLSSNVTVNVFILDQNDNVPVILCPVSSNESVECVEEIPRNVNTGHLVTKVRAYDADIGYNGWLLFSIQEVSDHSLFGLDRYTGQIRTLRSFTESDDAQHKLVILVKDNGNISLSATATVIIRVVEPKEAFAAFDIKNAEKDEEDNDITFFLIITLASVSVLFLVSIVVLIALQCSKSTDYSSQYLQDTKYDGTLCHSIQYRSGDNRYMLVGPRMSIGSIVPGSNGDTLVVPDRRRRASGQVRAYKKLCNFIFSFLPVVA